MICPESLDRNTVLTLMSDWYIAFKMDAIKENTREHLKSIHHQHSHIPFTMPDSLEDLYEKAIKDKKIDIAESEKEIPNKESQPIPQSKTDGE